MGKRKNGISKKELEELENKENKKMYKKMKRIMNNFLNKNTNSSPINNSSSSPIKKSSLSINNESNQQQDDIIIISSDDDIESFNQLNINNSSSKPINNNDIENSSLPINLLENINNLPSAPINEPTEITSYGDCLFTSLAAFNSNNLDQIIRNGYNLRIEVNNRLREMLDNGENQVHDIQLRNQESVNQYLARLRMFNQSADEIEIYVASFILNQNILITTSRGANMEYFNGDPNTRVIHLYYNDNLQHYQPYLPNGYNINRITNDEILEVYEEIAVEQLNDELLVAEYGEELNDLLDDSINVLEEQIELQTNELENENDEQLDDDENENLNFNLEIDSLLNINNNLNNNNLIEFSLNKNVVEEDVGGELTLRDLQTRNSGISCDYVVVNQDNLPLYIGKYVKNNIHRATQPMQAAIIAKDRYNINLAPRKNKETKKYLYYYNQLKSGKKLGIKLINRKTSPQFVEQAEALIINSNYKPVLNVRIEPLANVINHLNNRRILNEMILEINEAATQWVDLDIINQLIEDGELDDVLPATVPKRFRAHDIESIVSCKDHYRRLRYTDATKQELIKYLIDNNLTSTSVSIRHRNTINETILKEQNLKIHRREINMLKVDCDMTGGTFFNDEQINVVDGFIRRIRDGKYDYLYSRHAKRRKRLGLTKKKKAPNEALKLMRRTILDSLDGHQKSYSEKEVLSKLRTLYKELARTRDTYKMKLNDKKEDKKEDENKKKK